MNDAHEVAHSPDPDADTLVVVEEIIVIEEYAKGGRRPPHARKYRIRIDKHDYDVEARCMTGLQLLELAGKRPPERYKLFQKFHGGHVKEIGLHEEVDFTTHGVERFMTLPLDQTEG